MRPVDATEIIKTLKTLADEIMPAEYRRAIKCAIDIVDSSETLNIYNIDDEGGDAVVF